MNQSKKELLKEFEIQLRKYCHRATCKNDYKLCPKKCCENKLGLNTAIAWQVANELNNYLMVPSPKNRTITKNSIYKMRFIVELHCEKYPKLFDIIHHLWVMI